MEQEQALFQSRELGIAPEQVVREYWELLLLKELFESPWGRFLIFKGGTALRLAYQSPRFSEDIDFSLTENSIRERFTPFLEGVMKKYPPLRVTDLEAKRFTYLAEIKVRETYLPLPFRIKIEISRRIRTAYQKRLLLLSSPSAPFQVLAQVATLEQLYEDKRACLTGREKPQDLFDLWYLSQKLSKTMPPVMSPLPAKRIRQELRKYLPRSYWRVIEELHV